MERTIETIAYCFEKQWYIVFSPFKFFSSRKPDVCVVHQGVCSTPGDVQYTGAYHEYSGGYHEYTRGYPEYNGGVQYTGGYHEYSSHSSW